MFICISTATPLYKTLNTKKKQKQSCLAHETFMTFMMCFLARNKSGKFATTLFTFIFFFFFWFCFFSNYFSFTLTKNIHTPLRYRNFHFPMFCLCKQRQKIFIHHRVDSKRFTLPVRKFTTENMCDREQGKESEMEEWWMNKCLNKR